MKYTHKSFSVPLSISQERWDEIFGKKTPAGADAVSEDYSQRQCASCLERGHVAPMTEDGEAVPGLLQCGLCLARFPTGLEQAQKVTGAATCPNCDGTGRLRTAWTVFACAACGGTGARQP